MPGNNQRQYSVERTEYSPLEFLVRQRPGTVLLDKQLGIGVGNLDRHIFKVALAQREDLALLVAMPVLAHQRALVAFGPLIVVLAHGGDINKESGRHVDPSRIDHVQFIFNAADDVVWVDLEEVSAAVFDARNIEVMFRHVIIFGQEMYCRFRNLHVKVIVPGEKLQQSSAKKPYLQSAQGPLTFWFHHHDRSDPCIIHVSAPIDSMVFRYVCIKAER